MTRAVRNANAPIFFFQAANDYDLAPTKTLSAVMKDASKTYEAPQGATHLAISDPLSGPMTSSDF
jgi:hypothetical protein